MTLSDCDYLFIYLFIGRSYAPLSRARLLIDTPSVPLVISNQENQQHEETIVQEAFEGEISGVWVHVHMYTHICTGQRST